MCHHFSDDPETSQLCAHLKKSNVIYGNFRSEHYLYGFTAKRLVVFPAEANGTVIDLKVSKVEPEMRD